MNTTMLFPQGVRRYALVASLLVLSLVVLMTPRLSAQSRESWRVCVDNSLLDYNRCLGEAGTNFGRLICDLSWEFEVVRCTAEKLGDIRNAFNGG